ncbi:mercury(II) reductase [Alicyclobacillus ferrooxydans]|uniref:Mercuric reductase n=1 Tax=Alicyclobacillus ferrooxydans TaxID=471514 RepID=A0A0P9GSK7_9BACL|nr:mercury(II) reductase [Alicyclobacillus ferrooxydans]KPV44044.1 mercuric reductase [Alicyclobacillus ferrooxydans]
MQDFKMKIKGMTCTGCEDHIESALSSVGATQVKADFRKGEVIFKSGTETSLNALFQAVQEAGYAPVGIEMQESTEIHPSFNPDNSVDYDFVIIGSGGAAFSAAIEASKYNARIAMIERGTVGGTCVNIGCVPSKTMLRAGEINHLARTNPFIGLHTSSGSVDLKTLTERKNELVGELRQHKYEDLIAEYGFDLIRGEAHFVNANTVQVGERQITASKFLVATGASPFVPDIPGLRDSDYLTSTSLLELTALPEHLVIIGSGYIALELGQMMHNLGANVTMIQRSSRILKSYEPEVSEAVTTALREQGIEIIHGATYERVTEENGIKSVHVTVNGEARVITGDALLVAVGRSPNTGSLRLENAKVNVGTRGEILVDEYLTTSNPDIFAAGDVTLGQQFVYVAAYEGATVAANAFGEERRKVDLSVVPGVTFTNPGIATVGLTEADAKQQGYDVITSVLPLEAVPRALVNRETTGVLKLVADATSRKIIGAHVVAENAGDVIYSAVLAVKFGLTIEDLKGTLAPYLTMAEGLKLATLMFDTDVSKLSCCAG